MADKEAVNSDPIVSVSGLRHRYGAVHALRPLDLQVSKGTTIGLVGPDGVGKSSLLALIAGVKRIQHGSVHVLGGDMRDTRHRRYACARLAYMPQGLGQNLYGDLSVAENIDFFARLFELPHRDAKSRAERLLRTTDLSSFADRRVKYLSGGMKQKLGLCCALIHDPALLILDEPTTGIDPLSRRQFWDLIHDLKHEFPAMTVLSATAYMEEASHFDRIVMMDAGAILADGSLKHILSQTNAADLDDAYVALLPVDKRPEAWAAASTLDAFTSRDIAIEAKDLTRKFGQFVAVDRANFQIGRGEIFGFVGPNGCGKTTTMKMLTGLLPPSEGEARLFGTDATTGGIAQRRRLGYMSQGFSLYGELTAARNLWLHGRLFDLPTRRIRERISALTTEFGLRDVLEQRADSLPLGLRQRLSLAVALIHEPELLVLDEPTSGVDPVARNRFWHSIIALSREKAVTIFVSTHYLTEAQRCDRIALMNMGRVLAVASPGALIRSADARSIEDAFIALIQRDIARLGSRAP
jgi:ribosome-dependent ATPase